MNKLTRESIQVENFTLESTDPTRTYDYSINHYGRLGREIKISPKANITINNPGFKTEFFVESVNVVIGIGKDHIADLIMSKEAWEALNAGEPVTIITTEDFKKKYIYKK